MDCMVVRSAERSGDAGALAISPVALSDVRIVKAGATPLPVPGRPQPRRRVPEPRGQRAGNLDAIAFSRAHGRWRFAYAGDDLVRRLARCDFVASHAAIDQR